VASQDKELRSKFSERGLPRIFLRQKKYLVVEK
jgi:rRNA-processing protein FCF1